MSLSMLCPRPQWVSLLDDGPEPPIPHVQGYRLEIDADGNVHVDAADDAGAHYAQVTLEQVRRLVPGGAPAMVVVDGPAIARRGVMLDVSRDKVPTIETLELLIDRLATLKVNLVMLYLEHTFAHPGHDDVCGPADAYTADDIRRLSAYCRERHVVLAAHQSTLTHMERWLAHDRFASLAALRGGYRNDAGSSEPAASLDPAIPASFELAASLVSNVAAAFDANLVHVGLDEPIDLNPAVWDAIFDVPGATAPWAHVDNGAFCVPLPPDRLEQYAAWLVRLRALPALRGKEMLMWADVLAPHPQLLSGLPGGVTPVEWGYEATHPFAERCGRLVAAGLPFWVAPGTSSWSSFGGRVSNMSANIRSATHAAIDLGARGLLVCDWGNEGHFQYLPVSWPGFVTAAARSWNPDAAIDLAAVIDRHLVGDASLADATVRLGRVDERIRPGVPEAGTLASILAQPAIATDLARCGMTPAMLDDVDAEIAQIGSAARSAHPSAPDGAVWADEVRTTAGWLGLASGLARALLEWPGALSFDELDERHRRLLDEHRRLWLCRNRRGGLDDSLRRLSGPGRALTTEDHDGIDHP